MTLSPVGKRISIFALICIISCIASIQNNSNRYFPLHIGQLHPRARYAFEYWLLDAFSCSIWQLFNTKKWQNYILTILFLGRKIIRLPPRGKFCISKHMARTPGECTSGPCFYFFHFLFFYAKLYFYARQFHNKTRI